MSVAIRRAMVTVLALLGGVHVATAAPPEPLAALTFDDVDGVNTCLGWSASSRTMLCSDARGGLVDEADAILVRVDGKRTSIALIEAADPGDAGGEVIRRNANLRRINRAIKKHGYTEARLLWADKQKGPGMLGHGVTVHRSGREVLFTAGKKTLRRISLAAPAIFDCEDAHQAEVEVFFAGPKHVVVGLAHSCEEMVYSKGQYHVVRLTPSVCPRHAHCPPNYTASRRYLDRVCQGTLTDTHIAELRKLNAAGSISAIDLRYLYNAVGALSGYHFKKLTKLNRFFYAKKPTWLPRSCRCMPRMPGIRGTCKVKATHRKAQRNIKKLWKSVRESR